MPKPRIPLPPLEWVRAFEAAARSGSFTGAAEEMGLTQAAISQRIHNLEARLGVALFNRRPRGVSLTVAGEAWLPHVSNALAALAGATDELFAKPLQRIRIMASTTLISLWFAPRLRKLPESYQLSFHTLHTDIDLGREDTDMQVRFGRGDWPGLRSARLFEEVLTPMAAPALLAQSPDDWSPLPHIALSGPRAGWQQWAAQGTGSATPVPALRLDSFSQCLAAAIDGAGVILGSFALCAPALADGRLVRLSRRNLKTGKGYWLTASPRAVPARQWQDLVARFAGETG
jgi:LysR family transcriptional regulator, glycine cleavage system transcriptional activator